MIELKHVSFAYQGQEHDGLHDINLTIADGECVLFCGRSGCGKTTITRLVNGLIPQFYAGELTGSVLVDGQEISKLPMYQIAAKVPAARGVGGAGGAGHRRPAYQSAPKPQYL